MASVDLLRIVARRSAVDWAAVVVGATLLLAASTLLSTAVIYADAVGSGGLRRAILAAPASDRAIVATTRATAGEIDLLDQAVTSEIRMALGVVGGEVALVMRSEPLEQAAPAGREDVPAQGAVQTEITYLAAHRDLRAHAVLVTGRWPSPGSDPVESSLSEGAARALDVRAGDTLSLTSRVNRARSVRIVVTGTWRPDPADPYWLASPLELDGTETQSSFTSRGPFEVDATDLTRLEGGGSIDVWWRGLPSVAALRPSEVDALRSRIEVLGARLAAGPDAGRVSVTSGLTSILDTAARSIVVSSSGVLLVTLQFGVLALYAVVLVATLLHERRRPDVAFLQARGARRGDIAAMAAAEGLLFAVPAAVAATPLAVATVALVGSAGLPRTADIVADVVVTPESVIVSVGAALAGAVIFALPSVISTLAPESVRRAFGRPLGRSFAERLALDLVLMAVAVAALWQIRVHGSSLRRTGDGTLAVDPLLVVGPAVGILAASLLAMRILPRVAEIGERLVARIRGLVAPLGARQLARRPVRYTRAVLLLVLAAAFSAFAAAYGATWSRSQAEQAAYRSVADVRVTSSDYPTLPAWALSPFHRSLPGVRADLAVVRGGLDAGRAIRGAQLLSLDARAAPEIMRLPAGEIGSSIREALQVLAVDRPPIAALPLEGMPRRIELIVDARLGQAPGVPSFGAIPRDWRPVATAVTLLDGDGRLQRFAGESALGNGDGQVVSVPLVAVVDGARADPVYPLQLVTIDLTVATPPGVTVVGTVELRGAGTVFDDEAPSRSVPLDPMPAGWTWIRSDPAGTREYAPSPAAPRRMVIDPADPVGSTYSAGEATFRLMSAPGEAGRPIPVVVGDRFLELAGTKVGEELTVTANGQRFTARIIGRTALFPPLDPAQPFVVVDDPTLEIIRLATTGPSLVPSEWWLRVDGDAAPVLQALMRAPYGAASAVGRESLTRQLSGDPIGLAIIGALALGAMAAALLAAIGFLVAAAASIAERHGEFALLRALGLSPRQLFVWLSAENGLLLAFGLVTGTAIGLLVAWLVLPFQAFTESGAAAVPPPDVVVPWEVVAPLLGLGSALVVVSTLMAMREVGGISISGVLRAGDR